MAYGSGVFQQKNHDASASMVDLVFAVDDPCVWHAQNLERNPQHYSVLKYLGAANVTAFQEKFGAGVYYNTLVNHLIATQSVVRVADGAVDGRFP
ncbi:unnamed protein product [Phytophthora lilii]|uniref:Phosphatidate cytidylyltransferase, mitochondrial n=1 Tax=Phytophthora lilii TaxID=2077276 RepID=A0A9W6TBI6_9STRA|nr:unnamed protein product [Phytophthora lilii]